MPSSSPPTAGEITLSARLTGPDEAEIVVADRGIGLEPRALSQLFQPFFTQFDSSRHSSGDFGFNKRGLGLGLSIVKQFVELHGGRVSGRERARRGDHASRSACPAASPLDSDRWRADSDGAGPSRSRA